MRYAATSLILTILLALAIGRFDRSRLPQIVKGDDALSVAFGDAKEAISAAMVQKADSYFHGGIDMDCHCHDDHHADDHDHHDGHDHAALGLHYPDSTILPWQRINRHVRAPEKHVHLDGAKAVELLPWFYASVRANPHNIDAWTTAWYAANAMLKDKALARRILDEAKAHNPDSLEIAWTEARFVYDGGKGDVAAAERILEDARRMGKRKCGGRLADLSPHEAETFCFILDYLSKIYESRGDHAAIRPLLEEARATGADTPVIKWMESHLK